MSRLFCRALDVPLQFTWKERRNGRLVSCYGPEVPDRAASLDLVVELAAARGRWADAGNPLCTSTGKRDTSDVVMRDDDLVARLALDRDHWPDSQYPICTSRGKEQTSDKVLRAGCLEMPDLIPGGDARRILLLSGERAEESPGRAKRSTWSVRRGATAPTKGRLVLWHRPVHDWPEQQVWDCLARAGSPAMPDSYRQGFSRHSCIHCIHKPWAEMCLAFVQAPGPAALRFV